MSRVLGSLCESPEGWSQRFALDTVDASRNPAITPVEVGSLSHYLQGFSTISGGCLGFLNHQQYHPWHPKQCSIAVAFFPP